MKTIRMIALVQVVLAIVFAVVAWRLDPGIAQLANQFAETCHDLKETTQKHKVAYENVVRQILPMRNGMQITGTVLNQLGNSVDLLGIAFQKIRWINCKPVAQGLADVAKEMHNTGNSVQGTAKILGDYEKDGYPSTVSTFDKVIASLGQAENAMDESARNSRLLLRFLSTISSLIFLMNAVALWILAGKKNEGKTA